MVVTAGGSRHHFLLEKTAGFEKNYCFYEKNRRKKFIFRYGAISSGKTQHFHSLGDRTTEEQCSRAFLGATSSQKSTWRFIFNYESSADAYVCF